MYKPKPETPGKVMGVCLGIILGTHAFFELLEWFGAIPYIGIDNAFEARCCLVKHFGTAAKQYVRGMCMSCENPVRGLFQPNWSLVVKTKGREKAAL